MKKTDFYKILKSMSKNSIEILPNLIVATIDEKTDIGKTYADYYEKSPFCPYALNHYIELEFPNTFNLDEVKKLKTLNKFFDSPDGISGTNRFSGVFVISLLKAEKDFCRTEDYRRLLNYMKERKKDIKFVLLISPTAPINSIFNDLESFSSTEVIQEYTKDDVYEHITSVLEDQGFSFNKELLKKMDPSPEAIETLTMKLRYYALANSDKKEIDDNTLKDFINSTNSKAMNVIGFR